MEATTKDLRLHTAEILAAADRGETVYITYRGKRRAVLQGWQQPAAEQAGNGINPAFGLWADREEDVGQQVRDMRKGRQLP
ncbi:prevent-host-death family protein [Aquisalimonas sp. 2447]|uniref:prevent-host-death family protein n=1 Tax=Aquisalimonas sp. 2447 TaxID=2740807 RepID=UPI0014326485|nr:prevent-host-death family protein [Aquisalimonas sp. 2447]QIT55945.1 prevent-host-death family protein [Aquisalimonas sp. 2447]